MGIQPEEQHLAGVDLAWQSERNPSAISFGKLCGNTITITQIEPAVFGIDTVLELLTANPLDGIAIDAPLIINNPSGQRSCETNLSKEYGARHAGCHTSNTRLFPDARSVYLSEKLLGDGFGHLTGGRWQIECYPHPAIIEIFSLDERLKYKKGTVAERRHGQTVLAELILALHGSSRLKMILPANLAHVVDKDHIASLAGQGLKSNEDALDSLICLYIAGLYSIGAEGEVFGDVESGYIWVPQCVCV